MNYSHYVFDFEKLDVYQKSLGFTNEIFKTTLGYRKELQYSLGDQFRRAALSVCNNLAEGNRKSGKAKRQFYNYALDSARECIPMISLSVKQNQIPSEREELLRQDCIHICNMLYRLLSSVQN